LSAGLLHVADTARSANETNAMLSDLFMAAVLSLFIAATLSQ
jgi:hypothetical protein